uniref:Uncharacterized protein AlNc14C189G8400 n=1 Tax=Albugo laibachii Nc14 TaxID=890382 RepID=F0WPQ8_9STRA|nr:conserved hypothetical protein [Albugo laibachii Nc14]CCA24355.1 conserved hypothetical protein [Albugo laibachii Nc14]|eukprot:CCA24355.1 conserved hypothetical protein [Albugo laibachii Nc14]
MEEWRCTVTADVLALKVGYLVVAGLAATAGVIGTISSATPFLLDIRSALPDTLTIGGYTVRTVKSFLKTTEIGGFMFAASTGLPAFGISIMASLADELSKQGYLTIKPGHSSTWKISPLRWSQGTCVLDYELNSTAVRTETLYMRPIFSGGIIKRDRVHRISYWIRKRGTRVEDVVALVTNVVPSEDNTNVTTTPSRKSNGSIALT